MTALALIQLALAALQSVAPYLPSGGTIAKVVSEAAAAIGGAIASLQNGTAPETLAELEALRTTKVW
jgi:hypothetical protein